MKTYDCVYAASSSQEVVLSPIAVRPSVEKKDDRWEIDWENSQTVKIWELFQLTIDGKEVGQGTDEKALPDEPPKEIKMIFLNNIMENIPKEITVTLHQLTVEEFKKISGDVVGIRRLQKKLKTDKEVQDYFLNKNLNLY